MPFLRFKVIKNKNVRKLKQRSPSTPRAEGAIRMVQSFPLGIWLALSDMEYAPVWMSWRTGEKDYMHMHIWKLNTRQERESEKWPDFEIGDFLNEIKN